MLFRTQWVKVSDTEEELVAVKITPQQIRDLELIDQSNRREHPSDDEPSNYDAEMRLARSKEKYFTSGSNPQNIGKRQPYIPLTPEEESGILWD